MVNLFLIQHDPEFADCLTRILKAEGFNVVCVETIEQALPRLTEFAPAAVVVDLHDGNVVSLDDVSTLTEHARDLPILVTAHYQTPEVACKALGIGARDYLLKPFSTQEMLDRIRRLTGMETKEVSSAVDSISASIHHLSDIDDILQVCLDQLVGTLHFADCLIAVRAGDSFRIMASRGYLPHPTGRTVSLSPETLDLLTSDSADPFKLSTDGVPGIIGALGLAGHRPFPILMPLSDPKGHKDTLTGFVMGHGALVLEEKDLLEMERFLAEVSRELASTPDTDESVNKGKIYEREGELRIPDVPWLEAVGSILEEIGPYVADENDLIWIRLSLDEAIANAVVHGHGEPLKRPERTVRVRYSVGPTRLILSIEDCGEGFDPNEVPDPTAEENLLNINGRGIFIMCSIMDEVVFNERGNQVSLVKTLDGRPLKPFPPIDEADIPAASEHWKTYPGEPQSLA